MREVDADQHRTQRVVIDTERHRITGELTLSRDGYRSRMSDFLNASERDFVSLTDVTVEHVDGTRDTERHAFLAVSRRHIVLAGTDGE